MPIFMTRLVDDSGGIMKGGAAKVGRLGVAMAIRSVTSWRVLNSSTPGWNSTTTDESAGTDFDRSAATPGMPASAFSIGTVTSASTSEGDSPRQIVWISTLAGANSGKTSTGSSRRRRKPKYIRLALIAITRNRKRRLVATNHRIMARPSQFSSANDDYLPIPLSAPYSWATPTTTTVVPVGGPDFRIAFGPLIDSTTTGARTKTSGSGLV